MIRMELQEVINSLIELEEDSSIPKNTKLKISQMIVDLKSEKDLSLKVNKSLNDLDNISNDINIPDFIRTQVWGIASMLEKLQ